MNNDTKAKLLAARAFAQERKPAIARAILEATDDPKAQQMLAKLPKQSTTFPLMRLLTVLGVLILVAGTAYMIGYASAPKETVNVLFDYQPSETPTPHPDATLDPFQATMTGIANINATRIIESTLTATARETQQYGVSSFELELTAIVRQSEQSALRRTERAVSHATQTAISTETP